MADAHPSVVILCPQYAPETNAAARRITDLAGHLVGKGWSVRVVARAPHHPQNRVFPGYGEHRRMTTEEGGATVVRYRPWLVPKDDFVLRFASEMQFALQACLHVLRHRPDLIVASSPYMTLGPAGLLVARLTGARYAWDVRDLTWQYLSATGRRAWGIDRLLGHLMRFTARRADALTTATEGQLTYFARRPTRADVITNGLEASFLARLLRPTRRRAPGEPARVVYAGLVGYPQRLGVLVDVAARLPEVEFAVVGDGPERVALEEDARRRGLRNLVFPGFVDGDALERWYADADVLVAHLRRDPAFAIAQPSKLWEYMATGRPVVYGGEGEAVAILDGEGIGVTVPPESADAMATAQRLNYRAGKSKGYYSHVTGAYRWHAALDSADLVTAYRTHGYYALYGAKSLLPDHVVTLAELATILSEATQRRTGGKPGKGKGRGNGRKPKTAGEVADTQTANPTIPTVTVTLTGDTATALATLVEASGMTAEDVLAGLVGDALTAYQAV